MIFENRLKNGIRVIGETMPSFSTVTLCVWIGAGSVYERENEGGISHFIEHMMFKSTENRTAEQIAIDMDKIGGVLNAFTSKECTCYHVKVLRRDLKDAVAILSDMLHNHLLADDEIETEKGVVCDEILMTEETNEDYIHEVLCQASYGDTPIARPVTGTCESVESLNRDMLIDYMDRLYINSNMLISCAGNIREDELMEILNEYFTKPNTEGKNLDLPPCSMFTDTKEAVFVEKKTDQSLLAISLPGVKIEDPLHYALAAMNSVLGGSSSSRLFLDIREKHGLTYNVYSSPSSYRDTGYLTLYAGTKPSQMRAVMERMAEVLRTFKKEGMTEEELTDAKRRFETSFLMSQESTAARAIALGKPIVLRGRLTSHEEILAKINGITMDDIHNAIETVLDFSRGRMILLGKMEADMDEHEVAKIYMDLAN